MSPIAAVSANESPALVLRLPIAEVAPGPILPPFDLDHPTHRVLAEWDDPFSPRSAYAVPPGKTRVEDAFGPAIEWDDPRVQDRALVSVAPPWRDGAASCQVLPLAAETPPGPDDPGGRPANAGLVFRAATSRLYYFFCVEAKKRLVLYRRDDDVWTELAGREIVPPAAPLTLAVKANADALTAECPEAGVRFEVRDSAIAEGRWGFRARGACRLYDLALTFTQAQLQNRDEAAKQRAAGVRARAASVPEERHVRDLALPPNSRLLACDTLRKPGLNDLLLACPDSLCAMSLDGEMLWRTPCAVTGVYAIVRGAGDRRLIYVLTGLRGGVEVGGIRGGRTRRDIANALAVFDGRTGAIVAETELPTEFTPKNVYGFDISFESGRLTSSEATDILVRHETSAGARQLWALDCQLKTLWRQEVDPPYGHHNAVHFFDVNRDGRDEVLAGGTLLSSTGAVLWVHDRAAEMRAIHSAGHYDAAPVGWFAGDDKPPVAFLAAGSAGVYVVDALTGKTRAVHRMGHAQWALPCRLRTDLPGQQVLVGTRWGNFGILSLFDAAGERLWTRQLDYMLQGACPVQWTQAVPQLLWINTSIEPFGLYDGAGQMVRPLEKMRDVARQHGCPALTGVRLSPGPGRPDFLALRIADTLHLFAAL
ncbi:MAG TPA: hypothetical protein P5137_00700 [Candidatus Brocadiia bacterium]|nr:hypothetical protein [Candidatus Brocadiia bacterium]